MTFPVRSQASAFADYLWLCVSCAASFRICYEREISSLIYLKPGGVTIGIITNWLRVDFFEHYNNSREITSVVFWSFRSPVEKQNHLKMQKIVLIVLLSVFAGCFARPAAQDNSVTCKWDLLVCILNNWRRIFFSNCWSPCSIQRRD